MKKGQVVLGLFVPADEQATKAVHPRVHSFHHPTARFEPSLLFDGAGFFSAWADMGGKAEFAQEVAYLVVVIALVQAHPLWLLLCRLGTLDHDAPDRRAHQFHVMTGGLLQLLYRSALPVPL